MPIRGHSGVQGTAECGVDADKLPGGVEITDENCATLRGGVGPPDSAHARGSRRRTRSTRRRDGEIDLLYLVGGNFLDTMPDPENARRGAGARRGCASTRTSCSTPRRSSTPRRLVLVLPAQTRYERRAARRPRPSGACASRRRSRSRRRQHRRGARRVGDSGAHRPRAQAGAASSCSAGSRPADVRAEMGRDDAALRRHREARRRRATGCSGAARASAQTAFPNMPDGRARFSTVAHPAAGAARGQAHARHAARQAVQLDDLRAEGSDHRRRARRDVVLFARRRSRRARLADGDARRVRSEHRRDGATARIGPCRRQHAQAFWPECNVLSGARVRSRRRASPTTTPSSPSSARLQVLELQLLRRHRTLHRRPLQQRLRRRAHLRADA